MKNKQMKIYFQKFRGTYHILSNTFGANIVLWFAAFNAEQILFGKKW